jgi:hypothetical protein
VFQDTVTVSACGCETRVAEFDNMAQLKGSALFSNTTFYSVPVQPSQAAETFSNSARASFTMPVSWASSCSGS